MLTHFTPTEIRPPFARYSHGVAVDPGAQWLLCSGQLGIAVDDRVPPGAAEQARLCFANIDAVLAAGGMTAANVVRVNTFVTDRVYLYDYMRERDDYFRDVDPPPASTLMIVSGFAREEFKVEIEVLAAGPARAGTP